MKHFPAQLFCHPRTSLVSKDDFKIRGQVEFWFHARNVDNCWYSDKNIWSEFYAICWILSHRLQPETEFLLKFRSKKFVTEKNSRMGFFRKENFGFSFHDPQRLTQSRWTQSRFAQFNTRMRFYQWLLILDNSLLCFSITKEKFFSIKRGIFYLW